MVGEAGIVLAGEAMEVRVDDRRGEDFASHQGRPSRREERVCCGDAKERAPFHGWPPESSVQDRIRVLFNIRSPLGSKGECRRSEAKSPGASPVEDISGHTQQIPPEDLLDVLVPVAALDEADREQRPVRPGEGELGFGR